MGLPLKIYWLTFDESILFERINVMKNWVKVCLYALLDCLLVAASWFVAIRLLKYDSALYFSENLWYVFLMGAIVLVVLVNFALKLYSGLWKFAGIIEAVKLVCGAVVLGIYTVIVSFVSEQLEVEWSIITTFVALITISLIRFAPRVYTSLLINRKKQHKEERRSRVLIVGAGGAGDMLLREIKTNNKLNMNAICVLDDDQGKIGSYIQGVKVAGKVSEVKLYVDKYRVDEIIIAMPSVKGKKLETIVNECKKTNCKVRKIDGIYKSAEEKLDVSNIKDIDILDLLGREQIKVNLDEIMGYIEGKVVLVTGGGGSIGSELCRQIAMHNPSQLIIVDIYENNAYDIQQELVRKLPNLNLLVLIASVRDSKKIDSIFNKYKPQIVFHAAAHKHVPLMETSPNEAIKNNVSGTLKVADAAGRNGAERFILISTDKAVNPTNIMGASKRICEMIIQTMDKKYNTEFVAVRFGNVLGSNGSVVPLFKKQIEEGGPVTVTHKDIVRYFMTIPEAVSLVLQAGAYAKGGEIFVLDMGEPVKIYDLAVKMIKLYGFEPNKDIAVKITGLRPGEKLYEERLMAEEGLQKTANEMISIGKPLAIDEKNLFSKLEELYVEAYKESERMKELVKELVPTYTIDKRNN